MDAGKRRKVIAKSPLERAFQNTTKAELDNRIGRMFYAGRLSFHFTRSPNYHNSYAYATTHAIPGYVPPRYNVLRTTLLQKERANVKRLLKPIKDFWLANGVSIIFDGWSNPQRRDRKSVV